MRVQTMLSHIWYVFYHNHNQDLVEKLWSNKLGRSMSANALYNNWMSISKAQRTYQWLWIGTTTAKAQSTAADG